MKKGQRLLGLLLGLMIGISLLTVSVLAAMGAAEAQGAEAPVLYASGGNADSTPTPSPTPTTAASTGMTTTPTPIPTATPDTDNKSGVCGDGLVWEITGSGMLVISGEGAMDDYEVCGAPWYSFLTEIRVVEIGEGVTYIGANAFCDCVQLTEVTLSSTVTAIGDGAFNYCNELTAVYFTGSEEQWERIGLGEDNGCFESADVTNLYRDVNGDGVTDVRDVTRLMRCVLGAAEPCGPAAGNYNGDDVVDILDVICLLRRIAG